MDYNTNRPMPTQQDIDYNDINRLLKNGAQSITVDTGDTKMTMKKVGIPTAKSQRSQSGQMQTQGTNQLLSQLGGQLGPALEGLVSKLGVGGGQQGKGAGMLNELAAIVAQSSGFGRNQMGSNQLGGPADSPPIPEALKMASSMNGGAPTVPEQVNSPAPVSPGSGMSTNAMGMMGPTGGAMPPSGAGGLAGLLGPMMSAAGKGAPAPSNANVPPVPAGLGSGGINPQLAAMLGIPGRASGGPVAAGQPYVVGEQGPEVVVPQESGTVVPNQNSTGAIESQVSSLIDEVIAMAQERGIPLLGPDGNMSPEALSLFIEVLQSKAPTGTDSLDPMAEQMGGGPTTNPGYDPLMGAIGSGAGGSNNAPMLDALGGGAMAPDITGSTPSGPDDIQALLAALGG